MRPTLLPPVIKNLLILNGLVYLAQMVVVATDAGSVLGGILASMQLYPVDSGYFGPWQVLTYGFMHSTRDFGHILFNMFALWMFGVQLENDWGSR